MTFIYIIIILLLLIIVGLIGVIFYILKKQRIISDEDKEYITFVIDMYIDYAKELKIHSEKQHDIIVKRLKKIKDKYFN